jgi:putative ABC transport system permease protein
MTLLDSLLSALDSLRANMLRTALTTLGIVIGVAAVIAMVAIGVGAERRMQDVIRGLGANVMVVVNGTSIGGGARRGAGTRPALTMDDAAALERQVPSIQVAAGAVGGTGQVIYGNTNWFTLIQGVSNGYLESRDWSLASGRGFSGAEARSAGKVAVLGQTVIEKLFEGGDPVGRTVRIMRVPFTVIGTLHAKGQTPWGRDSDDVIFLPLTTAKKRVLGGRAVRGDYLDSITVKARSAELVEQTEEEVTEVLRQRHRIRPGNPDDFIVRNIAQIVEARAESQRTMAFLLASVAGVSLLVGGIGIMNIMLVSVTERTREIGLRMAVGAARRDIMVQFVIEAVALSLIGGLIGIALGAGGSLLAAELAGWQMVVAPSAIALAVGFSAAVGIFFGWYPALKASRLDPIEALRHE